MPILTLQRRLREAGRIRIGRQVTTANGRTAPAKLDTFRFTSSDHDAIVAIAGTYGGEPHEWADAPTPGQWELFTDAKSIAVTVPPASAALSQWLERWNAGGCERRCDGIREMISDSPCLCDAEGERTCAYTTRCSVLLAGIPGLGTWRLETHGYYAASELAGMVELLEIAATRGMLLPATLRIDQRQVKRLDKKGKPITLRFAVPVLDIPMPAAELGMVLGQPGIASAPPSELAWQPIDQAALPPAPEAPPVAEQVARAGEQSSGRRRQAEQIRPTGATVRRATEVADPDDFPEPPDDADLAPELLTKPQGQKIHATFGDMGITGRNERLAVCAAIIGHQLETSSALTKSEASLVIDVLERIARGELELGYTEATGDPYIVERGPTPAEEDGEGEGPA